MERPLVVDNYDSFTYNLVHLLEALSEGEVDVCRPENITEDFFNAAEYVVFSPGPGLPDEMPRLMHWVNRALSSRKKTLGVCLGHQALAVCTGGGLKNLKTVHHGVSHFIETDDNSILFQGMPSSIAVARYHSWIVDESLLSAEWRVNARGTAGEVMAMSHKDRPVFGVQFHPESVLTPMGTKMLLNFLRA